MDKNLFTKDIRRIEAAGIKTFKPDQIQILFEELYKIPDQQWSKFVGEYLLMDNHDRNIMGFFKNRFLKWQNENIQNDEPLKSDVREVSPNQNKMFTEILNLSLAVFADQTKYLEFWKWFEKQWNTNTGASLDNFLSLSLTHLQKFPIVRNSFVRV